MELIEHVREVHNVKAQNIQDKFPKLEISQKKVLQMMGNVAQGKAITFDGISNELFRICKDCRSKPRGEC